MPAPDLRARQALRAHPSPQTAPQTAARRPAPLLPGAPRPSCPAPRARSSNCSRGLAARLCRSALRDHVGGHRAASIQRGLADDRRRGRQAGPQGRDRAASGSTTLRDIVRRRQVGPPACYRPGPMCVTGSESEAKHETRLAQMRENTRNLVQFFSADAVSDITNAPVPRRTPPVKSFVSVRNKSLMQVHTSPPLHHTTTLIYLSTHPPWRHPHPLLPHPNAQPFPAPPSPN